MIASRTGTNGPPSTNRIARRHGRRSPKENFTMDALITVFAIVAALFVLDIAAVLFGADTRDDFGDDAFHTTLS
jgi:hypothetical protein